MGAFTVAGPAFRQALPGKAPTDRQVAQHLAPTHANRMSSMADHWKWDQL